MFMSSTYVYASRQVEAALVQKSFPHSIVPNTEDDPVSLHTVLQAIAEIARFLKNFECGIVGWQTAASWSYLARRHVANSRTPPPEMRANCEYTE